MCWKVSFLKNFSGKVTGKVFHAHKLRPEYEAEAKARQVSGLMKGTEKPVTQQIVQRESRNKTSAELASEAKERQGEIGSRESIENRVNQYRYTRFLTPNAPIAVDAPDTGSGGEGEDVKGWSKTYR